MPDQDQDTEHRTRAWESASGSSTIVQFRTDIDGAPVWMHTNIGWIPIGNAPEELGAAEDFAVKAAAGYGLEESPEWRAEELAGWDELDED